MAYRVYEDLPTRTASDKVLHNKAFGIAIHPWYDGYQRRVASMIYKFFDKKSKGITTHRRTWINSEDQQLVHKLHRPIAKNFKKCKVY